MKEKLSSVFLDHMVEAFADISDFVRGQSLETFRENKLVSNATARALLIVGEASSKVRVEVRERFPEIPWQVMSAMRNRSVHNYIVEHRLECCNG